MKIAIAQIGTNPGKIEQNTNKILQWIDRAKDEGAEMVIFPELTIPGYASMDLFLRDSYVEENIQALKKIVKHCQGIKVFVGFVDVDRTRIRPDKKLHRYNSSAYIENGKIIALRDKTLIPEYDVFMEKRYFSTARQRDLIPIGDFKVGLQICEDIYTWGYPVNVTQEYAERGMNIIINMSASPFSIGKRKTRIEWIKAATQFAKVPVIYANTVGSYDGFEGQVVFDGRSQVYNENGNLIAQGKAFQEDLIIFELSIKSDPEKDKVLVHYKDDDTRDVCDALTLGLCEYALRTGFKKAILGISGGLDSAVVACLAVDVFGPENVTLLSLPTEFSSSETKNDAQLISKNLNVTFSEISIQKIFEEYKNTLSADFKNFPEIQSDTTFENIQSRIRGATLMAFANRNGAILLNTGNKTELALGYCTLYGDMNGGISVLGDISKARVYELAHYLNRKSQRIPTSIIERTPTAELKPNQTDEQGLGAAYSVLSPLTEELVETDYDYDTLITKYPKNIVDSLILRIKINEFKRRQAPPAIRVTEKAFGIGRRIPIAY
ncbi:MAG: NAD+ synthase [bacterium]|nr:NAD+ synthase [bacterium]